jgi:hypothetical protein
MLDLGTWNSLLERVEDTPALYLSFDSSAESFLTLLTSEASNWKYVGANAANSLTFTSLIELNHYAR